MKLLFISRFKDAYSVLAPEKKAAIQSATFAFVDKYSKSGACLDSYYLADMKGAVSIWDVTDSEDGARISLENPVNPFIDNEIIPLIETDAARKVIKEMMEAAQKAAKK